MSCLEARTTSGPDLALQGHQSRGPAGPGFVGLAKSRSPSGPGSVGLGKKRDPRAKGQGWPWVCHGQIDKKGKKFRYSQPPVVLVGVFTDIEPETLNSKASDTERRKLADAAELFLF